MKKRIKKAVALGVAIMMVTSGIQPLQVLADHIPIVAGAAVAVSDIPAFPGAEGGGKFASGGRGCEVYIVTNLKDYAESESPIEGSLRYGLQSNRTIVFQVAGNIELKRSLRFDNLENITIAGQTAPGDGITISGWDTNISNSENIIIRYLRFRPGAINVHNGSDSMDAMWGRDNNLFMIDHCSFSWNTDECLSLYRGENGTIQWCMVYESLTLSGHSKGRHGYGGIAGGDNVTYHHNLYANHTSRNPRLGGGYAGYADADHVAVLQVSNNLIYNWGFNTCYGGGYAFSNYMNNYLLAGPGTRDSVENWVIDAGEKGKLGGFYIAGNYIASYRERENGTLTGLLDAASPYVNFSGDADGANITSFENSPYLSEDSTGVNAGITNPAFDDYIENEIEDADTVYDEVVGKAGATYPRRDALDARIAAEVENGLGRFINTEHEVGGFLSKGGVITAEHSADYDTDKDGMPDAWETEKGLDPSDKSDGTSLTAEGYTNLEIYLNSLVDMDYEAENPDAVITSPVNNEVVALGDTVTVSVEAESAYGFEIEKVEFYYSTALKTVKAGVAENQDLQAVTGAAISGTYTYDIAGLEDGSYYISARVYDTAGHSTQTTAAEIHVNADDSALGAAGWTSEDIGNPDLEGSGSLTGGILTVKGNGKLGKAEGSVSGISGNAADAKTDDFHFVYQEITGDVEIIAKLESISSVDNHAFAGIMIREDLSENSAAAALGLSWVKYTNLPWSMYLTGRDTKGGNFDELTETLDTQEGAAKVGISLQPDIPFKNGSNNVGYWMRLVRKDDTFFAYSSPDGDEWKLIGTRIVTMGETVYAGFAVDSNTVANDIRQLNTARFSNVEVNKELFDIHYDLTNIAAEGAPQIVSKGSDFTVTFTCEEGYRLPETVQVQIGAADPVDMQLSLADPLEGTLKLTNVTGEVTITAEALEDTSGVEQVKLIKIDEGDYLHVSSWDNALILNQTAAEGQITKNAETSLAKNVSYLVFPKTTDAQTMEMDITITAKENDEATSGLFVGAFQIGDGREYFNSLGLRNTGKENFTGYWTKANLSSGNGGSTANNGSSNTKPSYLLEETYHVTFTKTAYGYQATYTGIDEKGAALDLYKLFKLSETPLTLEDEVQYGFALVGVSAKIENLTLKDSRNRIIYDQNTQMIPSVYGSDELTLLEEDGLILDQTSASGQITKTAETNLAQNVSYYAFPATNKGYRMELDITIRETVDTSKERGLFAGVFQIGNETEYFASLGFRNVEAENLTGYWYKSSGTSGNGSSSANTGNEAGTKPTYAIDNEYHVSFEKTDQGYQVTYSGTDAEGKRIDQYKLFKYSEGKLTADDMVQYGLAITGVKAEIKNLQLYNEKGTLVYNQDTYLKDIELESTVTSVTVTPNTITLNKGDTQTFHATVNGTNNPGQSVIWTVTGGTAGTAISADGLLTVAEEETAETLTVTAVSTVDGTKSGTAAVTVMQETGSFVAVTDITGVPAAAAARTPLILTGTAVPSDATNKSITWSIYNPGSTGATLSGSTLNTVAAGTVIVRAVIKNGAAADADYMQDFSITVHSRWTDTSDDDDSDENSYESAEQEKAISVPASEKPNVTASVNDSGDTTGTWKLDGKGWWYQRKDSSYPSDSWLKVNGQWYIFGDDGYMKTGWTKTADGSWFYMDDTNGNMVTGWKQTDDGKWYFLDIQRGEMANGWLQTDDGKWYFLDVQNGDMKTGWIKTEDGKWYFLDVQNGDMKTGWLKTEDDKWYFLNKDGSCAINTTTPDGHRVDENGVWVR